MFTSLHIAEYKPVNFDKLRFVKPRNKSLINLLHTGLRVKDKDLKGDLKPTLSEIHSPENSFTFSNKTDRKIDRTKWKIYPDLI